MNHPHQGHRERLRQRYLNHGLDSFADHEVLELLLFQYLPYRDTNEIAHALLDKFGNLANVLDATAEQLMTVKGIGLSETEFERKSATIGEVLAPENATCYKGIFAYTGVGGESANKFIEKLIT